MSVTLDSPLVDLAQIDGLRPTVGHRAELAEPRIPLTNISWEQYETSEGCAGFGG